MTINSSESSSFQWLKDVRDYAWRQVHQLIDFTLNPFRKCSDLDEIYSLVTLLRPGHFATAATFRAQFVDTKNPTSPRNRERLRGLLSEIMIRNTRASCGLALPPRFVTTMLVEPLPAERALYQQVLAFLRERGGTPGVRMLANVLLLGAGSSPAAVAATLARVSARDGHDAKARVAIRS